VPPRGYRRKSTARPPLGGALRALATIVGSLAGVLAVGYLLIVRHGDPSSGRAAAERQLREITLEPAERVRARTDVFQRNWYDYFRSTSGILVATDRRLIYVGVLPAETFTRENGPRVIDTRVYPGDTTIIVQPRRAFLGAARGVAITTRDRRDVFAVSSRDEPLTRESASLTSKWCMPSLVRW